MAFLKHIMLFLSYILSASSFPVQDGLAAPTKYIITLKNNATDMERHLSWVTDIHKNSPSRRDTAGVKRAFSIGSFNAYAGEFDLKEISQITQNPSVLSVEEDVEVLATTGTIIQTNAPWGIASLSNSNLPNGNQLGQTYEYDESAGAGTYAYVMDTGVLVNNTEFEGRAIKGYNAWPEEHFEDDFGHGTHVAGIIGSKTFGVAKKATVVDVKVCRSVGYTTVSHVLDGLQWVVKNVTNTPGRLAKSVINVSLALPYSSALNAGFKAAYDAGVLSVVGAANDGKDASTKSPASEPTAFTVGAVAWNKTAAGWSNFGPLVDIFAPGVDIASLWNKEGIVSTNSGTSMASPHVAGLVAYLRGKESLDTPDAVTKRVRDLALKGVVKNGGTGSPNVLAFHGAI